LHRPVETAPNIKDIVASRMARVEIVAPRPSQSVGLRRRVKKVADVLDAEGLARHGLGEGDKEDVGAVLLEQGVDLTARVKGDYQGDHAKLKDALNTTAEALHGAIAQVAEAVEQVTSASTQIASSSQSVASGASEQASSLEETHASLESMTAQTRQAADSASQASILAAGTRSSAQDGAAAMEQMQGAMGKIRHSAEGTSAIIKDISEKANLRCWSTKRMRTSCGCYG
jgi:hypothetical protein